MLIGRRDVAGPLEAKLQVERAVGLAIDAFELWVDGLMHLSLLFQLRHSLPLRFRHIGIGLARKLLLDHIGAPGTAHTRQRAGRIQPCLPIDRAALAKHQLERDAERLQEALACGVGVERATVALDRGCAACPPGASWSGGGVAGSLRALACGCHVAEDVARPGWREYMEVVGVDQLSIEGKRWRPICEAVLRYVIREEFGARIVERDEHVVLVIAVIAVARPAEVLVPAPVVRSRIGRVVQDVLEREDVDRVGALLA